MSFSFTPIFVFAILLTGIYISYISYTISNKECPPAKIEFRYIPRTFKEEMEDPVLVTDLFDKMFKTKPLLS